jgi:hypothetical protein
VIDGKMLLNGTPSQANRLEAICARIIESKITANFPTRPRRTHLHQQRNHNSPTITARTMPFPRRLAPAIVSSLPSQRLFHHPFSRYASSSTSTSTSNGTVTPSFLSSFLPPLHTIAPSHFLPTPFPFRQHADLRSRALCSSTWAVPAPSPKSTISSPVSSQTAT